DKFLTKEAGLKKVKADPCIYTIRRDGSFLALGVHVDDILFVHNDTNFCQEVIDQLSSKFDITDLGVPTRLLGLRIHRDEKTGSISLDQEEYVKQLLMKFNMFDCNPTSTPQQPGVHLSSLSSPSESEDVLAMKQVP
ncbi:reverse transcriptase domain-containing protein, partial [Bacillus sp. SRB_8]